MNNNFLKGSLTNRIKKIRISNEDIKLRNIIPKKNLIIHNISKPLNYPKWVEKEKLYSQYGTFMDYLIRRILYIKKDFNKIHDNRVENILYDYEKHDDIIMNKIYKSYNKYIDPKIKTKNILNDIWIVSFGHTLCFSDNIKIIDLGHLNMNHDEFYNNIEDFLLKSFKICNSNDISDIKLYINPILGYVGIPSDADLILEDYIIEIKCSKKPSNNITNFLQLLAYASFSRLLGHNINKICIINPILGIMFIQDISNWEEHYNLFKYLNNGNDINIENVK